jgi:hypothetical protein
MFDQFKGRDDIEGSGGEGQFRHAGQNETRGAEVFGGVVDCIR